MKYNKFFISALMSVSLLSLSSCDDYLDREPISAITPQAYFNTASDLSSYAIAHYDNLPNSSTNGWIDNDNFTDCQASAGVNNIYKPGEYQVGASGGNWEFKQIRECNYFFEQVLPKYEAGLITGADANIRHYIGEVYLLRACAYFSKLKAFGDFPIVTKMLHDNKEELVAECIRKPRNEVARFILSDIDEALKYLSDTSPRIGNKTQINKDVANFLKARFALFEGTWEKYHKGTAFVPGGPGWPGDASYTVNIDQEVTFFLTEAMNAAKIVADKYALTPNTGGVPQPDEAPMPFTTGNPYFDMFGDTDMSSYSEVIMWREYKRDVVSNNISRGFQEDNGGVGVTRAQVENFLMEDGKPIYNSAHAYKDDSISLVRKHRDNRLYLFLKQPGQYNLWVNRGSGTHELNPIEIYPWITGARYGREGRMATGYAVRKYQNPDAAHAINYNSGIGHLMYRSAEAYLNYMEASYVLKGSLDADAKKYWEALRTRAKLPTDPQVTIAATDINQEAQKDWGAYSGGALLADATLYNIRRERRSEFLSEAHRYDDLRRWASFDQLIQTPYIVEGFKLWGPMQNWYKEDGTSYLKYGRPENDNNVSTPTDSKYLRPHRANTNHGHYEGYKWNMAHYLEPIAVIHFTSSATNETDISTSPLYQNPGWGVEAGVGAEGSN